VAPTDIAVIGGGIVGASAAASLARAGARVVLYERDVLAAAASGRNSGVVQRPFDPALVSLYEDSILEYRDLEASTVGGFELGPEPAGLLLVAHDEAIAQAAARSIEASGADVPVEVLSPDEVRRHEPGLESGIWACRVPIGFPIPPSAATRAFGELARSFGAEIREGTPAVPVVVDGRVVGVGPGGAGEPDVAAAGAVLVAAGPWSPALIDPSGGWRPIVPFWGVVIEIGLDRPPGHVLEEAEVEGVTDAGGAVADDQVAFSLVTAAGTSSLGSTFLADEPDPAGLVDPILDRAASFVTGIRQARVGRVRMCARPLSLDGRPLVGRVPGVEGLWIAAGHGPWGISTGPATGRLVADAILGHVTVPPIALDPGRFGPPRVGPQG
jgi:glycine/D-amino acid oxidase-like deaminating enzyme